VPSSTTHLVDLCRLAPTSSFDAVTCRGVLNDLVADKERQAALRAMAGQLKPGVLFVDVRDRDRSRERARDVRRRRRIELADGGSLEFVSTTCWSDGRLLVHEEHDDRGPDGALRRRDVYDFVMRPWSPTEITERLSDAGFANIAVSPGIGRRTADRLFVTAVRPRADAR
jgi:hypothetical protein